MDKYFFDDIEKIFEDDGSGIKMKKMKSRIEVMITSIEDLSQIDDHRRYEYFCHALTKLNAFVNAYRITHVDWKTREVTPENLHAVIFTQLIRVDGFEVLHSDPFLINANYENIIYNMSPESEEWVEKFAGLILATANPFAASQKHFANARTHLFNGFHAESVVSAQMAVESVIRQIFAEVLVSQGLNEIEVLRRIEDVSFMKMIKSEMPRILGGNWAIDNAVTPVSKWYSKVYLLRNRIVHGSYNVLNYEAAESFECTHSFLMHVSELIESKKNAWPGLWEKQKFFSQFILDGDPDPKPTFSID